MIDKRDNASGLNRMDDNDMQTTQLDGASLDIAEQRKRELKQLFPGAFTETRNDKGECWYVLDPNKAGDEVS